MRNVEEFLMSGNRLQGTVPICFGEDLTALRFLDLSNYNADSSIGKQSLSGTLPTSLCSLEHLEVLVFQVTYGLSGTLHDCLGAKQPQLQVLALQKNNFHGALPHSICEASLLADLYPSGNALTGTIPSCLGSLKGLAELDLDSNLFHGPIPEELCMLTSLEVFDVWNNALTGTIPSCLGNLSQLNMLVLDTNNSHGPIPEKLCQATALEGLHLWNNTLTGTLPSLSNLFELEVNNNQFHGPIPKELCQVRAFEHLWCYG